MITILLTILKVIILLGLLVFIHELGHFIVAKKCNVKVLEFSIGFGPKIFSKKGKETEYSLRMIPLGGFVNMLGEDEKVDDERAYSNVKSWKKFLILLAGGLVNIIFGVLVYFILVSSYSTYVSTKVESVNEDYSAAKYGIIVGDEIVKIDGKKIRLKSNLDDILAESSGKEITITVKRNEKNIDIKLIPTPENTKSIGIYLGNEGENLSTEVRGVYANTPAEKAGLKTGDIIISIDNVEVKSVDELLNLIQNSTEKLKIKVKRNENEMEFLVEPEITTKYYLGVTFELADKNFKNNIYYGFWDTTEFCQNILKNLKQLFTGSVGVEQLTGPIGISNMVAQTTGFVDFIYLLALISLSLGITNLLPFPPLDGGKIAILIIEAIRRKPFSEKTEITIQMTGFVLIIVLSIFVTYNDILRLF